MSFRLFVRTSVCQCLHPFVRLPAFVSVPSVRSYILSFDRSTVRLFRWCPSDNPCVRQSVGSFDRLSVPMMVRSFIRTSMRLFCRPFQSRPAARLLYRPSVCAFTSASVYPQLVGWFILPLICPSEQPTYQRYTKTAEAFHPRTVEFVGECTNLTKANGRWKRRRMCTGKMMQFAARVWPHLLHHTAFKGVNPFIKPRPMITCTPQKCDPIRQEPHSAINELVRPIQSWSRYQLSEADVSKIFKLQLKWTV